MEKTVQHGAYKETCQHCNQTNFNDRNTRTIENDIVCLNCIEPVRNYYRKGLVTNEEVYNFFKLEESYKKATLELNQKVKKYSQHNKEKSQEVLKDLLAEVEIEAIKRYSKVFNCCLIPEKQRVVQEITNNFSRVRKELPLEVYDSIVLNNISNGDYNKKFTTVFG